MFENFHNNWISLLILLVSTFTSKLMVVVSG